MKIIKKVKVDIGEITERFDTAFEQIGLHLVGREEEIEALKLCLLCNGHLMLEGPAGVAKSKLARLAFKTIDGPEIVRFSHQMMPNTQMEELFGPMSIKKLREEEIIYYNTKGKMPEAHFAYIDETYRGSDSVLTTLMGTLNERIFHNGNITMRCPLITAVGTTNFITDKPELEAFHDRWLITCQVKPADSGATRRKILDLFLDEVDTDDVELEDPISLTELKRLQQAVRDVKVPPLIKDLYEDMVDKYRTGANGAYVSDRRYCQAMRLVQAQILLSSNGQEVENPSPGCVTVAKYAILRGQSKEHREAMDNSIGTVIGNYERMNAEEPEIALFESASEKLRKNYDAKNDRSTKERQYGRVCEILEKIATLPADQQFTIARNQDRLKKVAKQLDELKMNLANDLGHSA
jgi:MoxR-like ATPase